jgi:hypothetical protein
MSREAMQMALEALESDPLSHAGLVSRKQAIAALRQALETEQEPVAWISEGGDVSRSKRYMDEMGFKCNPLYTAPPKKEWVGLTDQEINSVCYKRDWTAPWTNTTFARAIEAKLREKNGGEYRNGATTERTKLSQENT